MKGGQILNFILFYFFGGAKNKIKLNLKNLIVFETFGWTMATAGPPVFAFARRANVQNVEAVAGVLQNLVSGQGKKQIWRNLLSYDKC